MNYEKMGKQIRQSRLALGWTQLQLAERIQIGDKAVSKWERGLGCPDVSLLPKLSELLGLNLEDMLSGEIVENEVVGGNMKKLNFYVCPDCGNLLTATAEASLSCCGKKLSALKGKKPESAEGLSIEKIENELFIEAEHPMTKDHYITFVALLTGDTLILKKTYPEWNLQIRMPAVKSGILVWYCSVHGLFQEIYRG